MSIIAAELKWYKSDVITDLATCGGVMSINEVVDGVKNNIFPDVSQAERLTGVVRHRKVFAKLINAANDVLINPGFHVKGFTPGEDRVELFVGDHTDVAGGILGSEQTYGAGALKTDVSGGGTIIEVTIEDATQDIFEATGNRIWIGNSSYSEYHDNVSASKVSSTVTLTLDAGAQLANAYAVADPTVVASVIYGVAAEMIPVVDAVTPTTAGDGSYDDTGSPVAGSNIGSIEETFTLTFDSATTFNCVGAVVGSLGAGNTSSDFAPTNTDFSVEYFTLLSAGWTGTWASGDTLVIPTHPASQGVWCRQTVPAGSASYSGDNFTLRFGGESA